MILGLLVHIALYDVITCFVLPQIGCDKEGLFQEPARDRSSLYAQLDSIRVEHYKRESVGYLEGGIVQYIHRKHMLNLTLGPHAV